MQVACPEVILGSAVTSPAGTFTSPYPTGYVQADFTSPNNSATAVMHVNANDRYTEAADQFDISYDASEITITQKTGATLPAGSRIVVGAARIDSGAVMAQSGAIVALTDNTGDSGTHDDTLADGLTTGAAVTDNTTGSAAATWAAGLGCTTLAFKIDLANLADGDVLTTYTPGYKFKILSVDFRVHKAVTTADKLSTLNLEIGTTNVTGGAVALTSANCTPAGAAVAGSAVTAANTGSASDSFSIEAASTTAFAEGSGWLLVKIQNMDTADAMAKVAAMLNTLRTDTIVQNQNTSDLAQKVNEVIVNLRASNVIDT